MSLRIGDLTLDEVLAGIEPLSMSSFPVGSATASNGVTWFSQYIPFGVSPLLIKGAPGRLYSYYLSSLSGSTVFAQLFDSTDAPKSGDTPMYVRRALTNTDLFTVFDQFGVGFSRKIWMAISSTAHIYTPITTNVCVVSGNCA